MAGFYDEIYVEGQGAAHKFLVNGQWRASASDSLCQSLNPSKGNAVAFSFQGETNINTQLVHARSYSLPRPGELSSSEKLISRPRRKFY